jgi:hypothetical protein
MNGDWKRRAQARWPGAEITGDGRWACRSKSECFADKVRLHHTLEAARLSVREPEQFDFVDLSVDFWDVLARIPEIDRD